MSTHSYDKESFRAEFFPDENDPAAAAAHQDEMDRLRELTEHLAAEYGEVPEDEQQVALDRVAAIDDWHDEQRPNTNTVG